MLPARVLLKRAEIGTRRCCSGGGVVDVAVVGGGAVGASVAYHLARLGLRRVVLLEKSELTAGSTWHAAGLCALYHAGINMKRIHYYSMNMFPQLEEETGQALSFHRPGSIRLATTEERAAEFRYQMSRQGWHPAPQRIVSPAEIDQLCGGVIDTAGILCGLYNPADGHIDPNSMTMAFASAARKRGATIVTNSPVTGMRRRDGDGTWQLDTPQGGLRARQVVNAAGFWAREVGLMCGMDLPLVPVQHQYMLTKPIPQVQQMERELPVLRHLEGSFYMRAERGGLLVGPYEPQDKMRVLREWATDGVPPGFGKELFQPDLDRLQPHLESALDLAPCLRTVDVSAVVNGPITYTPDLLPLLGPTALPGMWMAAGFGYGIIHSGGAGKYLADWMVKGEPPFDLVETDPGRFGKWATSEYVSTKAAESYGMNNSHTHPREERWAGRPTARVSGAYSDMLRRGAEMGFHAGWEQPAWFSEPGDPPGYRPSFRRTNWFGAVARECQLVMNKVGIIDLTPFAKFDAKGPGAAQFLDKMLANRLPKVGRTNISHMLTPRGRVYAELTVTRLAEDEFFLITGSGSEEHDLRWLQEHARLSNAKVEFANLTDEWACLGVAGPRARDVIAKLANGVGEAEFPFLAAKVMEVGGVPVRAIRISYTGELGWELYHESRHTLTLYRALLEAGEEFEIGDFGTYALNVLRMEKGFRMWGAEMNMDSGPFEAGLGPFVRLDKGAEFVGKAALVEAQQEVLPRKLVVLRVDSQEDVDPEGNESVWCSGKVVGFTTSGCFGHSVGHGLAFAYVPPFLTAPGTPLQVELLGSHAPSTVLPGPPLLTAEGRKRHKK